jgi:hypothetical protein
MACQAMSERGDDRRQIDEDVSGQGRRRWRGSAVGEVLWQGDRPQRAGFADVYPAPCRISIHAFKQNRDPLAGERMEWMRDDQPSALAKAGPLLLSRNNPASDHALRSRSEIRMG